MGDAIITRRGGKSSVDLPKLNSPTVKLNGRELTITNPSTNGNFSNRFKIFANGILKSESNTTSYDLYTYFDEDGTYSLEAKCAGDKFEDSSGSGAVSFTKHTPQNGVVWSRYAEPLSFSRGSDTVAARTENHIMFMWGSPGGNNRQVDLYDTLLTHTTAAIFNNVGSNIPTNVTLYGRTIIVGVYSKLVYVIDDDLTISFATELPNACSGAPGTVAGNCALFAGGYWGGKVSGFAIAYNDDLTQSTPDPLPTARYGLSAASAGENAIMYTGNASASTSVYDIDAYDGVLTRKSLPSTGYAARNCSALSYHQYALFTGGTENSHGTLSVSNAFDNSLTRTAISSLHNRKQQHSSAVLDQYAIVVGGVGAGTQGYLGDVNIYDLNFTESVSTDLGCPRYGLAGGAVGGYALFAGGCGSSGSTNIVDVYTIKKE